MIHHLIRIVVIGCIHMSLSIGIVLATDDQIAANIRNRIKVIQSNQTLQIGDARIASITVLPELYENNGYQPLWTNPSNIADLFNAIKTIDEDGLRPDDYHFSKIEQIRARINAGTPSDPEILADYDLLLTDSLIRLGYHLVFGKVDPEDHHPHWNLAVKIDDDRPVAVIQEILAAGNLAQEIEMFRPQNIIYNRLKSALKKYRAIKANGGWEAVPEGPTLKKGMTGNRVLFLRRRLEITGDLETQAMNSEGFDDSLEQAVIRFQDRQHHLTADGAVGKQTLAALNVQVEDRIDQIRINLVNGDVHKLIN